MSPVDLIGIAAVGFVAGVAGGTLGIGGGAIFVPGLVIFYGLSQLDAQATSLLAMIPMAVVGAWRQSRYGNLRLRDGLIVGALSPVGVVAGTLLATVLSEKALQIMFAALQLYLAYGLMRRAFRPTGTDVSPDRV